MTPARLFSPFLSDYVHHDNGKHTTWNETKHSWKLDLHPNCHCLPASLTSPRNPPARLKWLQETNSFKYHRLHSLPTTLPSQSCHLGSTNIGKSIPWIPHQRKVRVPVTYFRLEGVAVQCIPVRTASRSSRLWNVKAPYSSILPLLTSDQLKIVFESCSNIWTPPSYCFWSSRECQQIAQTQWLHWQFLCVISFAGTLP